jgi:hypothetical protein
LVIGCEPRYSLKKSWLLRNLGTIKKVAVAICTHALRNSGTLENHVRGEDPERGLISITPGEIK